MVEGALIGTTQFDIFSLDPATCAENWRTHEDYPPALLPANRGAAYMDGMLFRGTQDGRVLAYDFKTGKRIWETTIADVKLGETVPSAPIAWDGLVFVGNAGGDFKGGKGHMFALDAKTGKIVWETFLVPQVEGDIVRGPLGASPLDASTWDNPTGIPISGGGTWTSYTLDPETGRLYVPGGNPAPDFVLAAREGDNLLTDSVIVLDARTGDYADAFQARAEGLARLGRLQPADPDPNDGRQGADGGGAQGRIPLRLRSRRQQRGLQGSRHPDRECRRDLHARRARVFLPRRRRGRGMEQPVLRSADEPHPRGRGGVVRYRDAEDRRRVARGEARAAMGRDGDVEPVLDVRRETDGTEGYWAGWVYAVDADTGVWKWRLKSNYPILGGMTPTAGGLVFVGDIGGNFYALDAANGEKLWGQDLGGAIGGGVITYAAGGAQKVAVAAGFTHLAWPTKIVKAKVVVLGLDDAASR